MLEKDGPKIFPATAARKNFLSEAIGRSMSVTSAIRAAALPYDVTVQEDMASYDIRILLLDNRQNPPEKMVVRIPQGAMTDEGISPDKLMKAVAAGKARLQKKLAERCDEPEIRLWAAEYRDVDLMDNSEIPSRIRIAYRKQLAVENEQERLDKQRLDRAAPNSIEQSIETDNDPIGETPAPRVRKIKRRPRVSIKGLEDQASKKLEETKENIFGESIEPIEGEEKTNVPVRTVKGAHPKTPVRKPRCNNRDHDEPPEMEFFPEDGVWKCPEPGCKTIARPKGDAVPVGQVLLGKGQLDFRVIFDQPGGKPSILLLADNNVALDITPYVDMENFLKYSRARQRAKLGAAKGEKIFQFKPEEGHDITALLRFPSMRIYGCDNA